MTVTTDSPVLSTVREYGGDQALLLEFGSTAEVLAWAAAIRHADLLGVLDIVPRVAHHPAQAGRAALCRPPTRQRLSKVRVDHEATAPPAGPMW